MCANIVGKHNAIIFGVKLLAATKRARFKKKKKKKKKDVSLRAHFSTSKPELGLN